MLYFYNRRSQEVSRKYYAPDTRGEESVGFFYFDDGLTRVRIRETDGDGAESFREALMLFDGSLFPLPDDYTVRAYSDSVILLEKDGLFGYMNSRGVWLTAPEFTEASPFYEGLAVVTAAGRTSGAYRPHRRVCAACRLRQHHRLLGRGRACPVGRVRRRAAAENRRHCRRRIKRVGKPGAHMPGFPLQSGSIRVGIRRMRGRPCALPNILNLT